MIARSITHRLIELLGFFPAVTLTGARQVGKTTLARSLTDKYAKPVRYFDLERLDDYQRLSNDPGFFLSQFQDDLIIIDEVQRLPELFTELRALIDEYRVPGRFLLLGSASPLLMRKSSESLAGRVAYLTLYPFSLEEIGASKELLKSHWWRGGFPDSWLAPSEEWSFEWREEFIKTYVERDLPFLGLQTDPIRFRTFLQMLSAQHGNLWNAATLARSLGISGNTVKRYLNFLEASFIALVLRPFHTNIKKRLVKSPKVYFSDSGLLHALLGIRQSKDLPVHPSAGASWEGYVISECLKHLPKGIDPYFFRTSDGTECDLLLVQGNRPLSCIEIKLGNVVKPSQGFYNIIETLDTKQNFILTYDSDTWQIRPDISVMSLISFLKKLPELGAQ